MRKTSILRPFSKGQPSGSPPLAEEFSAEMLRAVVDQTLELMTSVLASGSDSGRKYEDLQNACLAGAAAWQALAQREGKGVEDAAQELAWDAYDAPDEDRAIALALMATAIDPDCVDAAVIIANWGTTSPQSKIDILRAAVRSGETRLGRKYFRENKGHFWGPLESRPYMRARLALGQALAAAGQFQEAISHYEALLELNPNDNQGARDFLLALYLRTDHADHARRLLERYVDGTAVWLWAAVLEKFISGEHTAAARALEVAKTANPRVLDLLTGRKKMPRALPESHSIGSAEEAVICADLLLDAWRHHRAALKWLRGSHLAKASNLVQ